MGALSSKMTPDHITSFKHLITIAKDEDVPELALFFDNLKLTNKISLQEWNELQDAVKSRLDAIRAGK